MDISDEDTPGNIVEDNFVLGLAPPVLLMNLYQFSLSYSICSSDMVSSSP